ncbi:MAG: ABC transporter substrate-binding protein [Bacillota bacterium]
MKKTWTQILGMLLVVGMVLAGCSSNGTENNNETNGTNGEGTSTTQPNDENTEPVKLSVFMAGDPEQDYNTNKFTLEVEEMLNIDLDIQVYSNEVIKDQRQLTLNSGDYPEVFMLTWSDPIFAAEQMKLGEQGVYVPLNDLIEEHAPNILQRMEEIDYYRPGVTAPDGNIYALPAINECYHCSIGSKMWINTEWLEAVDMDMPTTTEEFREVLRAFKNNDLNGNGQNDEVPLSGSKGNRLESFLMNAFIFNNSAGECKSESCYMMVNNGQVDLTANKPEFKAGLEYVASLYEEGLIDLGALSQDGEAYKQVANREGIAMVGAAPALHPYVFIPPDNPVHQQYMPIPPLTGPDGVQLAGAAGSGIWASYFAITNKATEAQQIAAIKLADYLASEEGTVRMTHGEEGVNWKRGEAGDLDMNGKPAKYKLISKPPEETRALNNAWSEIGTFVKTAEHRASWAVAQDIMSREGYELRLHQATQLYDGHQPDEILPSGLFIDPAEVDEFGLLATDINKYIGENMIQFISGNKKLDKDWDSYVAGFEKLKLNRYLEIIQTAMDSSAK